MNYRPEIDGLRAIAIFSVIFFHAGFDLFRGGFIGVDIFFVISGYLITMTIISDVTQNNFSVLRFYGRRIRRILPALYLVMFSSILMSWFLLFPSDMRDFSKSIISTTLFLSNILFWRESGYFDTETALKPMMHTWSLSVEEQFYLLFPIVILLFKNQIKILIWLIFPLVFIGSIILAQWGSYSKPTAAFFLLPTRIWEFLIGVFVALYLFRNGFNKKNRVMRDLVGWIGISLILYALFAYSRNMPFPSSYTLVPTIGTALVILFANNENLIGKFLGNKIFVCVGVVSYSAYLWHEPIFVFYRHLSPSNPSDLSFIFLTLISLVLACFTWKYVEEPFRSKLKISNTKVTMAAVFASLLFIVFGLVGYFSNGIFIGRPNIDRALDIQAQFTINHGLSDDCETSYNESISCSTSDHPEVLIWGDSYAMHLTQGFVASNPDVRLVQKTVSMCGPILDIAPVTARYSRAWSDMCIETNDKVLQYIKNTSSIKYVVLSSIFLQYTDKDARILTRDGAVAPGAKISLDAMVNTVNIIKSLGKVPIIFSPTPQNSHNIGRCLAKSSYFNIDKTICDINLQDSYKYQSTVYTFLNNLESAAPLIWLNNGLCGSVHCKVSDRNTFIYLDAGHLSSEGSAYLGNKMNFYGLLRKY